MLWYKKTFTCNSLRSRENFEENKQKNVKAFSYWESPLKSSCRSENPEEQQLCQMHAQHFVALQIHSSYFCKHNYFEWFYLYEKSNIYIFADGYSN